MNLPTLSVVMANYNHAQYIGESLNAILSQSIKPLEIIIVDDCSTDNSVEVIEQLMKTEPLIRLVRNETNQGANFSFNYGADLAQGDYLCLPSADDRILPGFFEKSLSLLAQYPTAGLCCSHPAFLDDATGEIDTHDNWFRLDDHSRYVSPEELVNVVGPNGLWIAGHTCMVRRDAFLAVGKYIPSMKWYCDWFVFHVIAFRHGICYIPEPLSALRVLATSYSAMGSQDTQAETQVIKQLVKLLKMEQYQDVIPQFRESRLLDKFSFAPVLKRLLSVS